MKYKIPILFSLLSLFLLPGTTAANACQNPQVISFPFAVQANTLGIEIKANATINGNVRSNGNISGHVLATINGDATAVGNISTVQVTGTKTASAPALPLPALNLAEWETAAAAGGIISGDLKVLVNSTGNNLGPTKINGNLILDDNSELVIKGNIFVTGNISIGNNAAFKLDPAFGSFGTVIIALGQIKLAGNASVEGTNSGGFLLMASASNDSQEAIMLGANFASPSTVFYALQGGISVGPNATIIAAYGKQLTIKENSIINFVPGLMFASFICPSPPPPPPPPGGPILQSQKTPSKTQVLAGETFSYTITITNTGGATAAGMLLTDTLDPNLNFVGAAPAPQSTTTATLTWNLGSLVPGGTITISLQVSVKPNVAAGVIISNSIQATASNTSPFPTTAPSVTVIAAPPPPAPPPGGGGNGLSPQPSLPPPSGGGGGAGVSYQAVLQFSAPSQKTVGQNALEKITIQNAGNTTLDPGVLEITFPPEIDLATSTPAFTSFSNHAATWTIPVIFSGQSFSIDFTVKPLRGAVSVITTVRYLISGSQIALTTATENIGEIQGIITPPAPGKEPGKVAGRVLPRTGSDPFLPFLLLLVGISLVSLGHFPFFSPFPVKHPYARSRNQNPNR